MSKLNISFNEKNYNIDNSALSTIRTDFVSHLGTVAGEGLKIVVDGVEYSVDPTKLNDAAASLEAVLSSLGGSAEGLEPITWDGNTEGREHISNLLYKVSDRVFTQDQLVGAIVTASKVGEVGSESFEVNDSHIKVENGGIAIMVDVAPLVMIVLNDMHDEVNGTVSAGTYFIIGGDTYVSSLTFPS